MYIFFNREFNRLIDLKDDLFSLALCLLIGMSPDFDFIIFFFVRNPFLHRSLTHSVMFMAIVWVVGGFMLRTRKTLRHPFILAFLLVSGHIFWDFLTVCNRIPYGTMLLWPFNHKYYRTPQLLQIFPGFDWMSWKGLLSVNLLKQIAVELAIFIPLLLMAMFMKRNDKHENYSYQA